MKAFIGGLDTFVGAALAETLANDGYDVIGTAESEALAPSHVKMVLQTKSNQSGDEGMDHIQPLVREAQVIIYILPGREDEARSALFAVNKQVDAHTGERTFIGITHAMTWGRTLRPPLERAASETGQVEGANEEDLAEGAEEEDGDKAGAWDKVREMGGVDRRKSEGKEKDKAKDKEHDKGDKGKGKGKDKEKEEEDGKGGDAAHGEREMERRSSHRQSATSGIESPSAGAKLRRRETSKGALLTIAEAAEVEDQADQDAVLTEGMETGRVPLVQGRRLISIERLITRAHRNDVLRTHVVCPGLVYGGGEDELGLHPLFRSAFEKPDAPLPLYGPGNNVLPTVHINDLVAYVRGVLACVPPQRYLLACEPGGAMLRDATDAISHALASGKVASVPWEEMLARPGLSHLLMHAPMEPTPLPDGHGPDWSTVPGMTHSLGSAVKEYKARRGLEALRVVLLGPPASGKTLLAHVIEKLYGIRRVHAKAVYEWATSLPEEHPARARVDAVLKGKPGRLPDDVMAETTRDFLLQPSLVTRGWVLDGFPKVVSQVEGLLASDAYLTYKAEMAAASGAKGKPAKGASSRMQQAEVQPVAFSFDERLAPTHVVMLECDDPTMLHRTKMMEAHEAGVAAAAKEAGETVAPTHNNVKDLDRRKKAYADLRAADKKDLDEKIKAWEKEKEAIAKAAEKAEKEMEKKKPGKGPAPEPYDLDKHLAELGPAPEHGGLVGALLAEGAVLHTMNTTMTPPEAEPRDPKAKMTKEEEERLVNDMLAADVAQTADRLVQMQRVLGVPRNYVGFPNDWDPFQPLLMLEGVSLPTPVGGKEDPVAIAQKEASFAQASGLLSGERKESRNPWKVAGKIMRLERRAELEAKPLMDAILEGHGHRLTQYLLDDVMPAITTALLGIKDPLSSLPDDPLSYLSRTLVSGADERVQENIDPYASPLYKLRRSTQRSKYAG